MVQKISRRGIKDLIHSEGSRLKAYKDSVGVWTIGVGHAATSGVPPIPKAGMKITKEEEAEILARDIARFEARVREAFKKEVPQHVFDGAVSFDFNTGGVHRASWVKKYNAGDLVGARVGIMAWKKPPEIIERRRRERDLIFDGKYYSPPVSGEQEAIVGGEPSVSGSVNWPMTLKKGMFNNPYVKRMQSLLKERYYAVGMPDGDYGSQTASAVLSWKEFNDHPTNNSDMAPDLLDALEASGPKPVSEKRAHMTTSEVAAQSKTAKDLNLAKNVGIGTATVTGASKLADASGILDTAEEYAGQAERAGNVVETVTGPLAGTLSGFSSFIADNWPFIALVAALGLGYVVYKVLNKEVQETRQGELV